VTPNVPTGYLSDGSTLNLTYTPYVIVPIGGVNTYSVAGTPESVTDPNDGNYYTVYISFGSAPSSSYKILRDNTTTSTTTGGIYSGATVYDLSTTPWSNGTTVTPTGYTLPGLMGAADTSGFGSGAPPMICKDLVGTTPFIQFQDNSGNVVGTLGVVSGALTYTGGSGTTTTIAPA
jgi:hypothetical protein